VYELVLGLTGLVLFVASLFDDDVVGIVLSLAAGFTYFACAYYAAVYSPAPEIAYVFGGFSLLSFVFGVLKTVNKYLVGRGKW